MNVNYWSKNKKNMYNMEKNEWGKTIDAENGEKRYMSNNIFISHITERVN